MVSDGPPLRVSVVALPTASATAVVNAMDDFGAVGRVGESVFFDLPPEPPPFSTQIVSVDGKPVDCPGRITLTPHASVDDAGHSDIVFVPALMLDARLPEHPFSQVLCDWVRDSFEAGAVVASACTGSFVLAQAGLLDGRPATTHWAYADYMQRRYPAIDVQHKRPIVMTGPEDRLVMGGTGVYFTDLTLYLIQRFVGPERTHNLAKTLGKFWRGDELDLFGRALPSLNTRDATIRTAQEWISAHLDEAHPVKSAAERVFMTERTFSRRFREATGQSPLEYVQTVRVEQARNLLERHRVPVEEIAQRVGYTDTAYFRRLFRRLVGVSPSEYRRRFKLPPTAV